MNRIVRLAEIAILKTGPFGTQLKASEYVADGIPVINVKNIGYGNVNYEGIEHITEPTCQRLSEHILKKGDIVFGRKGAVDRHCFISENEDGWFQGSDCLRVRITDNFVVPQYVSYYLMCSHIIKSINNAAVGSTMPSLNMDIISDIKIVLPSYEEQQRIANMLSIIDSKIIINKKINYNLQCQLKLIYDYWFTQFDFPDENGKPYRFSGGAMVWNEQLKRNIPVGWQVTSITDNALLRIIKPGISEFKGSKTYLATADIVKTTISKGNSIDYKTRESRANMQPTAYSVWFAKMKNSIKHLNFSDNIQEMIDTTILSTGLCGLQCSEHSFEYIASFIEHSYFEMIKDTLAHGATQEAVNVKCKTKCNRAEKMELKNTSKRINSGKKRRKHSK